MNSIYKKCENEKCYVKYDKNHNDYEIETLEYLKNNINVFQFYLFSDNEYEHIKTLYDMINPRNNSIILDMGCGTGEIGHVFKKINPTINYIGITNSEMQYKISANKIKTFYGDYHNIPLRDSSVDIIVFFEAFGHGDAISLLKEVKRVLKKGGLVFFKDFFSKSFTIYNKFWDYKFMGIPEFKNLVESLNFKIVKEIELPDNEDNKKKYSNFVNNNEIMIKLHNNLPKNQPTCPMCFYLINY